MKVFRTINTREFIKLIFKSKVVGREQSSINCFEIKNNEPISMNKLKRNCFCSFLEPLFYYNDEDCLMLELEIPDKEITMGYGYYFSPLYNNNIEGDPWYMNGEFSPVNLCLRSLVKNKVVEAHFDTYSLENVENVFVPISLKTSTELGWIERERNPLDTLDLTYEILSKLNRRISKEKEIHFRSHLYNNIDSLNNISVSLMKKILISELKNPIYEDSSIATTKVIALIEKMKPFYGNDFSALLEKNQMRINEKSLNIDYHLIRLIKEALEKEYISFNSSLNNPISIIDDNFKNFYYNFLSENNEILNCEEVKNFLYNLWSKITTPY